MNTPDLRDVWVIGADNTYDPDDTGGSVSHSHGFTGPLHTHTISSGGAIASGTFIGGTTDQSRMSGSLDWMQHRPPYKALAYIQKIN